MFEIVEFGILLSGLTLFHNKISLAQIFFHSVCILLLSWFKHEDWKYGEIYIEMIIGGIVPVVLEIVGLTTVKVVYRKVEKVN